MRRELRRCHAKSRTAGDRCAAEEYRAESSTARPGAAAVGCRPDSLGGSRTAGDPAGRGGSHAAVRTFHNSSARRAGNAIISVLIRAGVVPGSYLLTTQGRKTGQLRTNPVTIVDRDGRRWLVAPYGPVSWVHNARAAGRVTLRRRRETLNYAIREVTAEEAGPVLKQYVGIARPTLPYFRASKDAPVEEFIAEADRHPVFELVPPR